LAGKYMPQPDRIVKHSFVHRADNVPLRPLVRLTEGPMGEASGNATLRGGNLEASETPATRPRGGRDSIVLVAGERACPDEQSGSPVLCMGDF